MRFPNRPYRGLKVCIYFMKQRRIDVFVDESGQDTRGKLFIVAGIMVAAEDGDEARQFCESLKKLPAREKSNGHLRKKTNVWLICIPQFKKPLLLVSRSLTVFLIKQRIMTEQQLRVLQE